jgi:flagella basal body P-ring formation protein FlgA
MKKHVWVMIGLTVCCLDGLVGLASAIDQPERALIETVKNFALEKYPSWSGLEIKVTLKQADKLIDELKDLKGDLKLKITENYYSLRPAGNTILPIQYLASGRLIKTFLRAQIEVRKKIVTATRQIKRGQSLEPESVQLAERDIALLPQTFFDDPKKVIGAEAKTLITQNSVVLEWMVKRPPLIRRGAAVTIALISDNLLVKCQGVALEEGYAGGIIDVQRKDNRIRLKGKVINNNQVEVRL